MYISKQHRTQKNINHHVAQAMYYLLLLEHPPSPEVDYAVIKANHKLHTDKIIELTGWSTLTPNESLINGAKTVLKGAFSEAKNLYMENTSMHEDFKSRSKSIPKKSPWTLEHVLLYFIGRYPYVSTGS